MLTRIVVHMLKALTGNGGLDFSKDHDFDILGSASLDSACKVRCPAIYVTYAESAAEMKSKSIIILGIISWQRQDVQR